MGFPRYQPPKRLRSMQEIGACDPLLFWDPIGSWALQGRMETKEIVEAG